ncbi:MULTISPECIES: helix-turn-helix domain-containing protein [unclassified Caldicellulosiruptor]|uniref:helix-turn-helix domain-containing protein n=1 Tax=unclassified Caldicellulosiruptor TaxID=2622462 RepID=UPI000584AF46|nr:MULTISPECIES: helix-turn-helix domain-containing protein [unclassified Caldicellulosiruptor]
MKLCPIDNNTKRRRKFKHTSRFERGAIEKLIEVSLGIREIARKLGRNASTISQQNKARNHN